MKKRVIFFTGFPGSGKGTQGKEISALYNMEHLSTGELFRAEAKTDSEIGKQMAPYLEKGEIIPQDLTFNYLKTELQKTKYNKGIILDGYPKDLECYKFIIDLLHNLEFIPFLAIHFKLSREEVEMRLSGRLHCKTCNRDFHITKNPPKKEKTCNYCNGELNARFDDTLDVIRKRLDVYEEKTVPVLNEFEKLGIYRVVHANLSINEVKNNINLTIQRALHEEQENPYYLKYPKHIETDQTYHNHIDAVNTKLLHEIVISIEEQDDNYQNKIYPVAALSLGPQVTNDEYKHLYETLPNFHPIDHTLYSQEAFATGKMGSKGFNFKQILTTLEICQKYSNQGVMTELEEEIYSGYVKTEYVDSDQSTYWSKTINVSSNKKYIDDRLDHKKSLGSFWSDKIIPNIPIFELHHGFDIDKKINEYKPPISPDEMVEISKEIGLTVGGWFIFQKNDLWAYRSNEFSNASYEQSIEKLNQQAMNLNKKMEEIGYNIDNGFSLEKVIAMWRF